MLHFAHPWFLLFLLFIPLLVWRHLQRMKEGEGSLRFASTILLEGARLPAWRRGLGYVPQEVFLVDDTLRRNIAFGVPRDRMDEDALRLAVEGAQLEDLVTLLPEGLESRLGERGVMLSGGQRQRVAIARALYRRPSLLLFDEATAHLDVETERLILAALSALKGRVTMILVAHRPEALAICDRVVRLAAGRVVGRLAATKGD